MPFPSPGDLPDAEIRPVSPGFTALQVDSLPTELWGKPTSKDTRILLFMIGWS